MRIRWSRSRVRWTIAATALVTALCVVATLNLLPPDKKLEQLPQHRHAVADPQFRREMSMLLGPPIIAGNRVQALQNGQEIFPAMLQAIRGAQRTISFETYIYWSGRIGEEFTQALSERARAGVQVNVTVDWAGSIKMDQSMLRRMRAAGVRLYRYRPLHWYTLARLNNRTHRKLLVVDGRIGFTGGVGIADQWLGQAQDPEHWRDSHFRIEGPVVAQLQAAFNDNWIKSTGAVLNGPEHFPPLSPAGDQDAQLFIASPADGGESVHLMYLLALAASRHSIDLTASYFVPDALIIRALLQARQRGVRIRILVPGPHIDSDAVRLASRQSWGELLRAGVEISEYQPTMLHTKVLIVDRRLVSVGSTNFDIRSFRRNDEASLNVYDAGLAQQLTQVFESDLAHARPYTYAGWRQRPFREKLAEVLILPVKPQL